ncbi:MAG: hypothetical protein AB7R69_01290 [Candidatus Babeliales bacterium]
MKKYYIFAFIITNGILCQEAETKAKKSESTKITIDGGYLAAHKPEHVSEELGLVYAALERWTESLRGKTVSQLEYEEQFFVYLIAAIEHDFHTRETKYLRRIFNKGALESILEKTDLEEALVELIGDVEIDLINKFREFIRKRIEMRIAQLTETEIGQKIEDFHEKIENLPPFIKQKIEKLIIKLLENSNHIPDSIKEKLEEYAAAHHLNTDASSSWESISSYVTTPFTASASYLTNLLWPKKSDCA